MTLLSLVDVGQPRLLSAWIVALDLFVLMEDYYPQVCFSSDVISSQLQSRISSAVVFLSDGGVYSVFQKVQTSISSAETYLSWEVKNDINFLAVLLPFSVEMDFKIFF
jgi:hypothetical protein